MEILTDQLKNLSDRAFDNAYYAIMAALLDAAVEMARDIDEKTDNTRVREWSNETVRAYGQEANAIRNAVEESGGIDDNLYRWAESYLQDRVDRTTGDEEFVKMMIPFLETIVEMSRMAVSRTDNTCLLEIARTLIDGQEGKIESFRCWLIGPRHC